MDIAEREESASSGRSPRRSRRQRSAIERAADAVVALKGSPPEPPPAPAPAPTPEVFEATVPVAVVPPPVVLPTADGFRDLLGQAVGLRLDAVTRTYRM